MSFLGGVSLAPLDITVFLCLCLALVRTYVQPLGPNDGESGLKRGEVDEAST